MMKGTVRSLAIQVLVLLVFSGIAGGLTFVLHPRAPALYLAMEPLAEWEVTLADVEERWGGDVVWVDARIRDRFDESHVDGAILLNEQEWSDLLWEAIDGIQAAEKPIVVYCGTHACQSSRKVAERLRESVGLPEAYFLRRGFEALVEAGLVGGSAQSSPP